MRLVLARRSGADGYLAAMTDWTPRRLDVPLAFLPEGTCDGVIFANGLNADRYAADYRILPLLLTPGEPLSMQLAPGGGFVARLRRR